MGAYLFQTNGIPVSLSDSKAEEIGFSIKNRHNGLYYPGKEIKNKMSILDYQIYSYNGTILKTPLPEEPLKIRIFPGFSISNNHIYIRGDYNYAERITIDDYMQLKESICETHYGVGHFCSGGHGDPEIIRLVNEFGKKHGLNFPIILPTLLDFKPGKNWFDFLLDVCEGYQRFVINLLRKVERGEAGTLAPVALPSVFDLENTVLKMDLASIKKNTWRVAANQRGA